ncbi:heme-binding protein [Verrucomicrobiales bacterium BCK34]|nr:heme-binding protein [Verrucomicrobiales bacterium BCK34]
MKSKLSRRKGLLWLGFTLFMVAGTAFVVTSRAGYETASYTVEKKDGKFEVRLYSKMTVVTAPMNGESQNGSFGKLFQYISGANEADQKIAMTTPVFMPADSSGTTKEMQFVVPGEVAGEGAPTPKDTSVKLKSMSGGKYAALRFSGRSSSADRKKKLAELKTLIKANGLTASGSPVFAGYDPPWTPGPMRRNEVLMRVE